MTGMGIRLEDLVGLIAIFEANENNFIYLSFKCLISAFKNIFGYLRDLETKLAVTKRQTEKQNNSRF